jgi:Divergent InlB B-repeat domain
MSLYGRDDECTWLIAKTYNIGPSAANAVLDDSLSTDTTFQSLQRAGWLQLHDPQQHCDNLQHHGRPQHGKQLRYRTTTVTTSSQALKLMVHVKPSGKGSSVTSSPPGINNCTATCSATYTSGTEVTLTATAASGSVFAGWSGGGCQGTGACKVTLTTADVRVTATFNKQ